MKSYQPAVMQCESIKIEIAFVTVKRANEQECEEKLQIIFICLKMNFEDN